MITLIAIILFVLFLKIVGLIFGAGRRILGCFFSLAGLVISILLAMMAPGFVFYAFPVLIIIGVLAIALKP